MCLVAVVNSNLKEWTNSLDDYVLLPDDKQELLIEMLKQNMTIKDAVSLVEIDYKNTKNYPPWVQTRVTFIQINVRKDAASDPKKVRKNSVHLAMGPQKHKSSLFSCL